jgi:hypothetical protein
LVSLFCTKFAIGSHGSCPRALGLFIYRISQGLALTEPWGEEFDESALKKLFLIIAKNKFNE